MRINYESLTDNELDEMYQCCAAELEKRKTQKQDEDWEKAIEPLREYIKKYGAISINGESFEFYGDSSDDDFDEGFYSYGPGEIHI